MTLSDDHLRYPLRRQGMDHDLYRAERLHERPKPAWPDGAPVALWVTVALERFPLTPNADGPRVPGHMATPYPDYRTYTARDYGNRIGAYRVLRVLDQLGVRATVFAQSALLDHAPGLIEDYAAAGHEIAAHGVDANHVHHEGQSEDEEHAVIAACLDRFSAAGITPRGWLSPGRFESGRTPQLLAEAGLAWLADWDNDDLPYGMTPQGGGVITAMPYTEELGDARCMASLGQHPDTWGRQVGTAYELLAGEGGRVLHVALTPYVVGQPFRIRGLEAALRPIIDAGAWTATGSEIEERWRLTAQPSANAAIGSGDPS